MLRRLTQPLHTTASTYFTELTIVQKLCPVSNILEGEIVAKTPYKSDYVPLFLTFI